MRVVVDGGEEVGVVLTKTELRILYATTCAVTNSEVQAEVTFTFGTSAYTQECHEQSKQCRKELAEIVHGLRTT